MIQMEELEKPFSEQESFALWVQNVVKSIPTEKFWAFQQQMVQLAFQFMPTHLLHLHWLGCLLQVFRYSLCSSVFRLPSLCIIFLSKSQPSPHPQQHPHFTFSPTAFAHGFQLCSTADATANSSAAAATLSSWALMLLNMCIQGGLASSRTLYIVNTHPLQHQFNLHLRLASSARHSRPGQIEGLWTSLTLGDSFSIPSVPSVKDFVSFHAETRDVVENSDERDGKDIFVGSDEKDKSDEKD